MNTRRIPVRALQVLLLGLSLLLPSRRDVAAEPRIRVAVSAEVERSIGLRAALSPFVWIELVEADGSAGLHVDSAGGAILVRGADGRALAQPIAAAAADASRRAAEEIAAWAHREWLTTLSNPASGLTLEFVLEREGGAPEDGPVSVVEPGAELRWEARNGSAGPLWVTVFAISPDRGVSQVYPFRGRAKPLGPGDRVDQRGSVDLPEGARTATDVLKLVATSAPIDPELFLDPARLSEAFAALGRSDWRTAHHALVVRREVVEIVEERPPEPLVDTSRADALARAPESVEPAAEAAAEPRRARRRPPRTVFFGVHYETDRELGAVQSALTKLRTLCGRGGAACKVRRSFPEGGVFELQRIGRRLREGSSQTVASAFEQAYEIRKGLEASRVEPYLELEMPAPAEGAAEPAPPDRIDDAWQLTHIRARDAWSALRSGRGSPGREAEGIRVGHVDTGYRPHPEVWDGAGAAQPIRAEAGWDFVDGDADALDSLPYGPVEDPAHGTAAASLLASPTGCQLAGQPGCVQGVARGAEVVPLRARRAASHFHGGRLARVIHDAASDALPEPVDLVSVSMGGPPGWSLWRAVRLAERRGLLVVAPAGQDTEAAIWPARFPSVIAVTASDARCLRWSRSPGGSAVDVAAPGVDLWRASVAADGGDVNAVGSGTALAAAVTSGAAALWLARWRGDERLAALRLDGQLTAAFRRALRHTAWTRERAPAGTDCARGGSGEAASGPGMLDAAALLGFAPSAQGAAASADLALRDLPLFRSLYGPDAAPDRAVADYRGLFGLAPEADLERVAYLEAEVLHHYTMTREVTAAIDGLAAPGAGDDRFAAARRALLRQGLSSDLREALRPAAD